MSAKTRGRAARRPTPGRFAKTLQPKAREVLEAVTTGREIVVAPSGRYARVVGPAGQALAYLFPTAMGVVLDYLPAGAEEAPGVGARLKKGSHQHKKLLVDEGTVDDAKTLLDYLERRRVAA